MNQSDDDQDNAVARRISIFRQVAQVCIIVGIIQLEGSWSDSKYGRLQRRGDISSSKNQRGGEQSDNTHQQQHRIAAHGPQIGNSPEAVLGPKMPSELAGCCAERVMKATGSYAEKKVRFSIQRQPSTAIPVNSMTVSTT